LSSRIPWLRIVVATLSALVIVASTGPLVSAAKVPTLVEIRAAHHPGFDRIVFEFTGPPPDVARVKWTDGPVRLDPSHQLAQVQGNAYLWVRFWPAVAHQQEPPYESTVLPHRRAYAPPNIAHLVLLGDAEGEVSFGIGLMKKTRILRKAMLRKPSRFVVDVATDFKKGTVKVSFVDEQAFIDGDSPDVMAVKRKVPKGGRANGALLRLYAGPTQSEIDAGLVFIASGTTGHRNLRINSGGVARVILRGPCDSGGSALTVGDEVGATLRSRPAVDWVKIYDRDKETLYPSGKSDSLPGCLQP
jgi:hypothetical protein